MTEMESKVIEIVHEAGKIFGHSSRAISVEKDSKENYATEADLEIQSFLKKRLTALIPGSSFLGEEGDYTKGEYTWIVDPIDGTVNYSRGIGLSVISVALVHYDEVVVGVVYNPILDETYHATLGNGAFLNNERITVSGRDFEHSILCIAWSVYEKKWSKMCFDIGMEAYRSCEDIRRLGSAAYELCLMARGSAELFFEMRLFPWDYAASSLILTEAGGRICSVDGPIDLFDQCTVVAANDQRNIDRLLEIVKRTMGTFRIDRSIWERYNGRLS